MTDFARLLLLTIFGRILLYVWMEFPLPEWLERNKYIRGWHECDLCGGVPLFSLLFWLCNMNILGLVGITEVFYFWGIPQAILGGGIISFVCHLLRIGWQAKFESLTIE